MKLQLVIEVDRFRNIGGIQKYNFEKIKFSSGNGFKYFVDTSLENRLSESHKEFDPQ